MTIGSTSPVLLPLSHAGLSAKSHEVQGAERAREVARDLEALLVTQMIAAMRRTVPESGLLQASASRRTLDDAFDHELARALVADGSLGFAKQIEGQLMARSGSVGSPSDVSSGAAVAKVPAVAEAAAATARTAEVRVAAVANDAHVHPVVAPPTRGGMASDPYVAPGSIANVRAYSVAAQKVEHSGVASSPRPPLDETRVTSGFGMRVDPLTGGDRFHAGVDLGAPKGTPIRATADGEVVFSGRRGGAGNVVEVRHADGLVTSYAHAERTLVGVGQNVVAGDVIATVGSTGRSTGPHLHFSVRRDGQVIDPTALIPELRGGGRSA